MAPCTCPPMTAKSGGFPQDLNRPIPSPASPSPSAPESAAVSICAIAVSKVLGMVTTPAMAVITVAIALMDDYAAINGTIPINRWWIIVPVWRGIIVSVRNRISVRRVSIGVERDTDAYPEINAVRRSSAGCHENKNNRHYELFHS